MTQSVQTPIRSRVLALVSAAWAGAVERGELPALPEDAATPAIEIQHPSHPEHGDLALNLALKLAQPLRRAPLTIAESLADAVRTTDGGDVLSAVDVAAPGFINLRLAPGFVANGLDQARAAGSAFGHVTAGRPRHVNVEFVSANPTGPLHIGNARGAFVGDLLCRVLEGAGHQVTREYYFNDFGVQVRLLGASVRALRAGLSMPEEAYRGEYVSRLAAELPDEVWARAMETGADADAIIGAWASERVRAGIEASLAHLGVRFDVWRTESSLHDEGWVERAVERLRASGLVYEEGGATWFRSTAFGDDKDRVIRKSDGSATYFAADIGYVVEKFSRGFDDLVYVWGADHHGTVARVRNAAEAMGFDRQAVQMLLIAWVRFVRDGQEISMSKRAGEFITLDELLAEIGVDAARWYFAARGHTVGIDFDIELAKKQSAENPVYYVQYAHARIASLLRKAAEAGLEPAASLAGALDDDAQAMELGTRVLRLPEVVEDAASAQETQGLTTYATDLATTFHAYYRDRRVVNIADPATSAARLALVDAARLALANSLALMGISAPESM
ncbi:MAG: arginine--tRNA ligase [Candidatus Limnocylindrales bacterium]